MGYDCWKYVMVLSMLPVLAKGHEACFANNWQYHNHTHSCFRLVRENQRWTQARDSCAGEQLGSSFGVQTRLAKIDDANTNAFVRSLFPAPLWRCWIGLHYHADKQAFRWDGYPDETPKFTDPNWRNSSPSKPYVSITLSYWEAMYGTYSEHFVCQHRAKVIGSVTCQQQTEVKGLQITCTSEESPVKAKCEWTYKYPEDPSYGQWRPVDDPSYQQSGDSFTTTCSANLTNVYLGVIAFRMKMYPDIPGTSGLSTNENALSTADLNITVGHEACFANDWQYHNHTHSCFRLVRENQRWTQARDRCAGEQLGSSYGVQTRLVKIDDANTNAFVRSLFPSPGWICWIGLHYRADKQAYRWDGYPDETPKFIDPDWRDSSPSRPYVSITLSFWVGVSSDFSGPFVCQHRAKVIGSVTCQQQTEVKGLQITCASEESPIKAKCEWTYKYLEDPSYGQWRPVDDPSYQESGDSFTTTCSANLTNVHLGVIAFRMKMYPDIPGTSGLSTNGNALSTADLNITVVSPTDVNCHSEVHPNRLLLSCQIDKIFPEALCQWSYRYEADQTFNPLSAAGMPIYAHEVYTDSDGMLYYKSDCSMTLTRDIMTFRRSDLTVQVKVHPNIEGIDQNTNSDAFFTSQEIIKIGPAKLNKFTVNGMEFDLEVDLGDLLTFSCMAEGLTQLSVAIRKFDTSYVDTSSWRSGDPGGREVRKTVIAACEHNGVYICSVYNEENREEEFRLVHIRVRCAPTYCNEESRDLKMAVRPGQADTFELCVMAYPMPDLRLLKYSRTGWNRPEDLVDQMTTVTSLDYLQNLTISLPTVQPSHLGKYALNYDVGGSPSLSGLYFQLSAPLTYCNGEESVAHEVSLGQTVTLSMCLTAFPSPSTLHMQILARGTAWLDYSSPNVTITRTVDFHTLTNVAVTFFDVKVTDLGEYRLYDPQQVNGSFSSFMKFSLAETQPPCPTSSSGISTGTVVGVVIASNVVVVALTILSMIAFRKLRSRNEPKTYNSNSQSGPNNAGFDKPKQEAPFDSGYADVPEDFASTGRDFRDPSGPGLENGAYEGYELPSSEGSIYEIMEDIPGERQKKEMYDLLHPDDPNYNNLNREPDRKYVTIGSDEKEGSLVVYEQPRPTKKGIDV